MLAEVGVARIVEAIGRYRDGALSCVEAAEALGMNEPTSGACASATRPPAPRA